MGDYPITSEQWTAKDRTLAKLQEALFRGSQKEEQSLKPYILCWIELFTEQG